jgi:hypothetical protein
MQTYEFHCPHCGSRLRLKDRMLAGRTVPCPDCRQLVAVVAAADGTLTGRVAAAPEGSRDTPSALPATDRRHPRPAWQAWLKSPQAAGWLTAAAVLLLILVIVFQPDENPRVVTAQGIVSPSPLAPPADDGRQEDGPGAAAIATAQQENSNIAAIEPPVGPAPVTDNGTRPPATIEKPPAAIDGDPAATRPIDVLLAADVPRIDVQRALNQPILELSQTQPVEFLVLLRQVEEMAGVPIDVSSVAAPRLKMPVTLSLTKTTVGDILAALVEAAGLRLETTERGVRVIPAEN